MKPKEGDAIIVKWLDTVQDPKWLNEADFNARPDADCFTIGFYHKQDKEFIYISHTISRTEKDKTTIQLGCIVKFMD